MVFTEESQMVHLLYLCRRFDLTIITIKIEKMIEIVNIEKKTYEEFVGQFERFVKKMTEMGNRGTNKCLGDWLDNDEVCRNLKISKRTLQTLRDNGTLAYSQISHKTYYKQEDVDKVLQDVRDRKKDAAWRKPRKKSETKRDCITPKD